MSEPVERGGGAARPREAGRDKADTADLRDLDLDRLMHELRSPLAAIQAMADALAEGHLGALGTPQHVAYLASIRETARHALLVLDSMAGGPNPDAEQAVGPTPLESVATEVVGAMGLLAARAGVALETKAASSAGAVLALARATDIRQMLINLVANGIAHAGGGARVEVAARRLGEGLVALEVSDDGPGIAAGVLERLRTRAPLDRAAGPDFATRPRLGLALTRALAEVNGGRLEIESGADGTRARIVLPAAGPTRLDAPATPA